VGGTEAEAALVLEHLSQLIEVALRAAQTVSCPNPDHLAALKAEAAGLLSDLEARVGAVRFVGAFSEVQRRVQQSRAGRRREQAAEAVNDPQAFARAKVRFWPEPLCVC
jgi:hypothetical protein